LLIFCATKQVYKGNYKADIRGLSDEYGPILNSFDKLSSNFIYTTDYTLKLNLSLQTINDTPTALRIFVIYLIPFRLNLK
jgi:hypothetical protein